MRHDDAERAIVQGTVVIGIGHWHARDRAMPASSAAVAICAQASSDMTPCSMSRNSQSKPVTAIALAISTLRVMRMPRPSDSWPCSSFSRADPDSGFGAFSLRFPETGKSGCTFSRHATRYGQARLAHQTRLHCMTHGVIKSAIGRRLAYCSITDNSAGFSPGKGVAQRRNQQCQQLPSATMSAGLSAAAFQGPPARSFRL